MKTKKYFFLLHSLITSAVAYSQSPMEEVGKYTGDWTANYIMWMDPSQPPMNSAVKVHSETIMNGLFLVSKYTGFMMEMNYDGLLTIGYSNEKKKYVSTWMDNMNSGIDYREGVKSADGKSIVFEGNTIDSMTGKETPSKLVLNMTGEKEYKLEVMMMMMGGMEMKTVEVDLTRE
jgi:hypothetical protein